MNHRFSFLWVLGVLFSMTFLSAPQGFCKTKRLALLVANHGGGEGLERLRYAERDAKRMKDVLEELGGFSKEDLFELYDEESGEFLQALADLEFKSQQYQNEGFETVLLVYYSGHAENGQLRMGKSKLRMSLLRMQLENSKAEVRLAFIDSCGAGAISEKGGKKAPPFLMQVDDRLETRGQVIISSSSADEVSQESDEIQGSFFTHYLVSGLRGDADENQDGKVSLDEAYRYSYRRTVAATLNTRSGAQHPIYDFHIKGAGEVVLTRSNMGDVSISFSKEMVGNYLIVDLEKELFVAEVQKIKGESSRLTLPFGNYAIKKRTDTHLLLQKVSARKKGVYPVTDHQMEKVLFDDDYAKGTPILKNPHINEKIVTSFAVGLGGQAVLFEADVQKLGALFPAIAFVAFDVRIANLIAHNWTLGADIGFGARRHVVKVDGGALGEFSFKGQYSQLQLGASLLYDVSFKGFTLSLGPRLAFVVAHMIYDDGPLGTQSLPTFTPGMLVVAGWHPFSWFHVEASFRTGYFLYTADRFQHLAITEGLLSVWVDL